MTGDATCVLVVDDDDNARATAAALLDALGYRTFTARGSNEALEIIRSDPSIGLLLTEIVLHGGLGGAELARRAKKLNPRIAIVFSTHYPQMLLLDSETPDHALLIRKPWNGEQLSAVLADIL